MTCRPAERGSPATRSSLSFTIAARASDFSHRVQVRRRVETQHRRPAGFVMLRRLDERADISGKRRLELLNAIRPSAIRRFFSGLDVGDHHHRHPVPTEYSTAACPTSCIDQAAFDQRRDLVDEFAILVAAPPFLQRIDRGETSHGHRFQLIRRRRWPELDAQRARSREYRGLPADLPLCKRGLAPRTNARAKQERGDVVTHGRLNHRQAHQAANLPPRRPCRVARLAA